MSDRTFAEDRYERMPYRRCGSSGVQLPAISLGFWQGLGEPGQEDACRQCCYHAFDHGLTHFDLADNYGPPPGSSEIIVGRILKDMPRDELVISTKAGYYMWPGPYGDWGSRKHLLASLDESLKRLGLDYVDIFYHHRPDPQTPLEESLGALDQAVRSGKALYAGVSNYDGRQFCQAVDTTARERFARILIHQARYNMLDRKIKTDLLPHTAAAGVGVIAFCPLAQGRLTGRYLSGLPGDSRMGRRGQQGRQWYEQQKAAGVWDKAARLNEIARARGQSLAQMALRWILRDCRITSVLTGVSRVEQLADSLGALQAAPLSGEELHAIDQVLAGG